MEYKEVLQAAHDYIVAVTIASEVGPESTEAERLAVASVIRNRATFSGTSAVRVVMKPRQFSGVLHTYWGRYLSGESLKGLVEICYNSWKKAERRPTLPAAVRWYYSPCSMIPEGRKPNWANELEHYPTPNIDENRFKFYGDKTHSKADDTHEWDS